MTKNNCRLVIHIISLMLWMIVAGEILSLCVGLMMGDSKESLLAFMQATWATASIAIITFFISSKFRRIDRIASPRIGVACVAFGWLFCTIFGALPFVFCAKIPFADACFETASGLTTTGATVLTSALRLRDGSLLGPEAVEKLPHALLLWRGMMNWVGGVGIVFFALMILPLLKIGEGRQIYNAEVPGLKTAGDQLTPRLSSTVRLILSIYLGMTGLAWLAYFVCGMSGFDAICHSFATVATGGFSTKAASLAFYQNPLIHWVAILFMFLSASNFSLYIKFLYSGEVLFFKDEEFLLFLGTFLAASAAAAFGIWTQSPLEIVDLAGKTHAASLELYLRHGAFHVISVMSTTGFALADWNKWLTPLFVLFWVFLMAPGGCGGSTAGGLKYSRILVVAKELLYEIRRGLFPRSLPDIRINGARIPDGLVQRTLVFAVLYVTLFVLSVVLLVFVEPISISEAASAAMTCLSNVGPGIGQFGPAGGFESIHAGTKLFLSLLMITGRLELFTVLIIFIPSFWRR